MNRFVRTVAMAGALVAVTGATTVHAQVITGGTWSNMVIPNDDGTPFWDGTSLDGRNCNIGFFLLFPAGGGFGPCSNQAPTSAFVQGNAGRLGMTGNTPNGSYLSNVGYSFAAGSYQIEFLGNIAGYTPPGGQMLGVFTGGNVLHTNIYPVGTYPNSLTTIFNLDIGSTWYLGAKSSQPGNAMLYSTTPEWALFSSRAANNNPGGDGATWYAAFGDNAGDGDYNDLVVRITSLPEPTTFAMFGVGLGLVGMFHRRRQRS